MKDCVYTEKVITSCVLLNDHAKPYVQVFLVIIITKCLVLSFLFSLMFSNMMKQSSRGGLAAPGRGSGPGFRGKTTVFYYTFCQYFASDERSNTLTFSLCHPIFHL